MCDTVSSINHSYWIHFCLPYIHYGDVNSRNIYANVLCKNEKWAAFVLVSIVRVYFWTKLSITTCSWQRWVECVIRTALSWVLSRTALSSVWSKQNVRTTFNTYFTVVTSHLQYNIIYYTVHLTYTILFILCNTTYRTCNTISLQYNNVIFAVQNLKHTI